MTQGSTKKGAPEGERASLFAGFFLELAPSALPRGEKHCRRREELCVRKLGPHMEAIESTFSFPAAVATVERQEILVVEMHLDFVKVWLEINGFAETEVVRLGESRVRLDWALKVRNELRPLPPASRA
jgi:hypothetical protein